MRRLLVEHLGVDSTVIADQTRLAEDLGADELDLAGLVLAMDEEFGIEIPDADAENIGTVGDVIAVAARRVNAANKVTP